MKEWTEDGLPRGFVSFDEREPDEDYKSFGWYGWLLVEWNGRKYIASARGQAHPDSQEPFWKWWLQEKVSQKDFDSMEFIAWKCDTRGTRLNNKMRCRKCNWLNWDFITQTQENTTEYYCGLHGCARVDPDGEQANLDTHGSCGFSAIRKESAKQLELKF